jgi:M6 family metalloprotease-like protein
MVVWLVTMLLVVGSSGGPLVQAAPLQSHTAASTVNAQRTGTLLVVWSDPLPGTPSRPEAHYTLVDAGEQRTHLVVDEHNTALSDRLAALAKEQVTVVGTEVDPQHIMVDRITAMPSPPLPSAADAGVQAFVRGAQPFVTILCRFSDQSTLTPHPRSWYETLMGSTAPGLDHYWREVSYNTINLTGSVVQGWYNLPHPRSYYVYPSGGARLGLLSEDCTAAADADVFYPQFSGVNMIFNNDLGGSHHGGREFLTRDGQSKEYGATWIADDVGALDQGLVAHELGHAFGLPHSSGPYDWTYDSQWDVMSGQSTCTPFDPAYRCVAAHPIAYHKHRLGWIPTEDRFVIGTPGTHQLTLGQVATPAPGSEYLLAQVPINGSATQFYTLEARRFTGYDRRVPGEAVVIHHVDTTRVDREARVVDIDTNGNPNDAAAMWLPGETFRDGANGITITVDRATTSGFAVTITTTMAACPDAAYEPDSGPEQARPFSLGTTEPHAFCDAGDADWVFFQATPGTTYRIETRSLAPGTDTVLTVMGNRTSRTDDNGNGGKASIIEFTATQAGRYDVFAYQAGGAGSAAFTYNLRITAGPAPTLRKHVFIPMVQR